MDGNQKAKPIEIATLWVNAITLAVLAATMCGVFWYACEARQQTAINRNLLEVTERPVLTISGYNPRCEIPGYLPCAGVQNSGKSPAMAFVRRQAGFSTNRLPKGPNLPENQERMIVPPGGPNSNRIDFDQPFVDTQKGWFYLSGRVDYGTSGYYTTFCREYEINPAKQGEPSAPPKERECQDPSSNYIK